jgi:hypothetical protein
VLAKPRERNSVHMQITVIGLDPAEHIFQVHAVDAAGKIELCPVGADVCSVPKRGRASVLGRRPVSIRMLAEARGRTRS